MTALFSPLAPVKPPVQRALDLGLADNRPLVSIDTARVVINRDEQAIIDLVEDGRIQYAWNIASPGATKIERRIHIDSLRAYRIGFLDARTEDDYLATIFQHSRPKVRLSELYRALNCSSRHALQLLAEECFGVLSKGEEIAQPARTSPFVSRAAVIAFLKSRRLP